MRAYDIDGVLTSGHKPKKPYVVISGRRLSDWDRTVKEIGTEGVIYLRPYGPQEGPITVMDHIMSGVWKGEMINKLGVTEFHEDVDLQAQIIREYAPNCKIHMINSDGKIRKS